MSNNDNDNESARASRRSFLKTAMASGALLGTASIVGCGDGDSTAVTLPPATKNRVCEILGIEKPVISAPMMNLTDAEFVAAVSNAGGLGVLAAVVGAAELNDPQMGEKLAAEIRKITTLTNKPFGVTYPNSASDRAAFHELVLEVKPAAVLPPPDPVMLAELRAAGIKIIAGVATWFNPANDNLDGYLAELDATQADIMLVKCYGCGGTIPQNRANLIAKMQMLAGHIPVPLVPGGGITNAAGAKAAAAAGAEGVWVGTRFLATHESPAHPNCKQVILETKACDIVEFRGSFPSWVNANPSPKALLARSLDRAGASDDEMRAVGNAEAILRGMRLGDMDNWYAAINPSVDTITELKSCKEVVDELGDAVLAAQA